MIITASTPRRLSFEAAGLRRDRVRESDALDAGEESEIRGIGRRLSMAAPSKGDDPHAIRFGRFCLLVRSGELLADGVPVSIGNRALDVLVVLVEAQGELVTKDDLLSRVWPRTIVEENSLQFQISTLRKALGDDRGFIRTVSGRGYRFIANTTTPSLKAVPVHESPPPGNLPAPVSDLVGREPHLADVAALIAANRLVTLVGAGGIGKTRLGIESARRLRPQFADGVWLVELGLLSDPELVLPAVAAALGLGDRPTSAEGLAAGLASKRSLLVLDNCEHLIGAATAIAEAFLHASGSLRVIATSREPLRAEGEWVYRVPPLEVPPEDAQDVDDVMQHSAAMLFVERMRAAQQGLRLDARMAAATAKICRHLDGIPLAIELAAARAVALGVETLESRLDDRFSLLTDGRRTAPPRHQTLRATLDWSYELLPEPERAVMRRLSVFCGDFTVEAASRVATGDEIHAVDVVHHLANLVTKSLVAPEVGGSVPRYRLLETMRAYARDKLVESGELESVTERMAG